MTKRIYEGSLTDKAVLQTRSTNAKVVYRALFASEIFFLSSDNFFTTGFFDSVKYIYIVRTHYGF